MTQRVITSLICDMPHGGETPAVLSRTLVLDGEAREMDLCGFHDQVLMSATTAFMDAGRKVASPRPQRTAATTAARSATTKRDRSGDVSAVRAWAQSQGLPVTARGRLSNEVKQAYDEAHPAA